MDGCILCHAFWGDLSLSLCQEVCDVDLISAALSARELGCLVRELLSTHASFVLLTNDRAREF